MANRFYLFETTNKGAECLYNVPLFVHKHQEGGKLLILDENRNPLWETTETRVFKNVVGDSNDFYIIAVTNNSLYILVTEVYKEKHGMVITPSHESKEAV